MNIQGNSYLKTFSDGINTTKINDLAESVEIIMSNDTIDLIGTNILINGEPLAGGGGIVTNPLNSDLNIGSVYDVVDNSGLSLRDINLRTENIGTGLNTQYFMGDGSLLQYSANSGNSNFYLYKSHANTPGAPPANGFVYYNNNTQGMATIIYISHLTDDAIDIEVFFNNINKINDVYLQDRNDSTNYIKYNITGPPTIVVGSYIEIPVQLIVANGTGAISFGINHNILLSFFTNNIEVDSRLSTLETKTQNQSSSLVGNTFFSGILTSNFIKILGGVSSEFLKANGTLDSNTYFLQPTGLSTQFLKGNGTLDSNTYFLQPTGLSTQFLKGNGTLDSNTYNNIQYLMNVSPATLVSSVVETTMIGSGLTTNNMSMTWNDALNFSRNIYISGLISHLSNANLIIRFRINGGTIIVPWSINMANTNVSTAVPFTMLINYTIKANNSYTASCRYDEAGSTSGVTHMYNATNACTLGTYSRLITAQWGASSAQNSLTVQEMIVKNNYIG